MPREALDYLRNIRTETLALVRSVTPAQAKFKPSRDSWSIDQVLHHLFLTDKVWRDVISELIAMEKAGKNPSIVKSFADLDTSVAGIPKPMLPFVEVPFTVMNYFLPPLAREILLEYRIMPVQNPAAAAPSAGIPIKQLREDLRDSYEDTSLLLKANPKAGYRRMRYSHPILGVNNVPQLLRILALHEKRHQGQIRDILRAPGFPRAA